MREPAQAGMPVLPWAHQVEVDRLLAALPAALALIVADVGFDLARRNGRDGVVDEERDVRENSARSLGQLGPAAAGAIPALREALKDKDQQVSAAAAS